MTRSERIRTRVQNCLSLPECLARVYFATTLVILFILLWQGMRWYRSTLLAEQRVQVAEEVALRGSALSSAINRRFTLLKGLDAFIKTEAQLDDFEERFLRYSANLHANTSGLHNIVVAPDGVIQYIYPPAGNEHLLGYNLLTTQTTDLRKDIELAIQTEEIILGLPLDYAQQEWGVSARKAVYLEGDHFWGLVIIVIDLPTLLNDAGLSIEVPDLDFRLEDDSGGVIFETSPTDGKAGVTYELRLPEEPWILSGYPKEDWDSLIRRQLLPAQISGIVIILLLSGLVYVSVNRQARLAAAVRERTREIAEINRNLELRVAERTRELSTLMQVSQNVASVQDIQPLLSLILDKLQEIVSSTGMAIFLREDGDYLTLLTYRGPYSMEDLPTQWPLTNAEHYHEIIQTQNPVIIADISADNHLANTCRQTIFTQFGETSTYFHCWMGVPLLIKKRVIGLLVFHHAEARFYTQETANLALAFGQQAALAIENARLYEQTQHMAVLKERQRIARDLHDSVSQTLYSIALGAHTLKTMIQRQVDDDVRANMVDPIEHVLTNARAGLNEMRALIFELRPESLENEGLIAVIHKQVSAIQLQQGLVINTTLCEEPEISLDLKLTLYRITQEALHNIVKHSHASLVEIELICQDDKISLMIDDNGQGFDMQLPSPGLGLRSMQERVAQFHGEIDIHSELGKGTRITVHLPRD